MKKRNKVLKLIKNKNKVYLAVGSSNLIVKSKAPKYEGSYNGMDDDKARALAEGCGISKVSSGEGYDKEMEKQFAIDNLEGPPPAL
jgi:hypothetical protein